MAYNNIKSIYIDDKKGNIIQFELNSDQIQKLTDAFYLIKRIFNGFSNRTIDVRFLLHKYNINGKVYLGALNIYYSEGATQIATLGVSQKNRIFFQIKSEKVRVFAFETETRVEEYEQNIKEDLVAFLSHDHQKRQKFNETPE